MAGFTGEFIREKQELREMSLDTFIGLFAVYPKKLSELMQYIRDIDQDRNGYITQTELDDILKVVFSKEHLQNAEKRADILSPQRLTEIEQMPDIIEYNLKPFYIDYAATANRILVDHK